MHLLESAVPMLPKTQIGAEFDTNFSELVRYTRLVLKTLISRQPAQISTWCLDVLYSESQDPTTSSNPFANRGGRKKAPQKKPKKHAENPFLGPPKNNRPNDHALAEP